MARMRMNINLFPGPLLAKAFAALYVIIFALDLDLTRIILERDSLQVIQAIKKEEEDWRSVGMVIGDIKQKIKNFSQWIVNHVKRETIVVVRILAKNALHISDVIVNMDEYSLCILSLLSRV